MIPDNYMADRLNAVKEGNKPPGVKKNDEFIDTLIKGHKIIEMRSSIGMTLVIAIVSIVDVLFASVLYGYATKALFNMDWVMLEALGIGFVLNNIFSLGPKFIVGIFNKFSKR